jgi:SAM-dependent methyltransferase
MEKIINWFYFCSGIVFLLLAKIKHHVSGYSPMTLSMEATPECVQYDIDIVNDWLAHLTEYALSNGLNPEIKDKHILELGPGSDLGIGLYLLAQSAKKYTAVDVYDLVSTSPPQFYEVLFDYLKEKEKVNVSPLKQELEKTRTGKRDKLNYICRDDFDIEQALGSEKVDIIFSNAAFEHFNDIHETIRAVSSVASSGAVFVFSVDLMTHSRWIRSKDPNNIYRYPQGLYKLLSTRSTPNRVRPYQYAEALQEFGWENIQITPGAVLADDKYNFIKDHLNKKYKNAKNQMQYLNIWICATKS